jgi:two-component system phosphate regulon response regulator PhoB
VLLARVRAQLRRQEDSPGMEPTTITYKNLTLDLAQRRVMLDENEINLTYGDFELLRFLCATPGHVYTRQQIVVRTKGSDYPVTERAVDVQIVSLRKKLGAAFGMNLETVRGVGYRMRGE